MRLIIWFLAFMITGLLAGYPSIAQEKYDHQPVANPLIDEMAALDTAFGDVVSGVALGDGEKVHQALESMHGKMEKTHEGLHAGKVNLPKNNNQMSEFVKMDKQFHEKLEALAEAGKRNDQKEMLSLTKQVLDGCVECHQKFRK